MVHRMKYIVSHIIQTSQVAFTKGRAIQGNIFWANEIVSSEEFWTKGGYCLKLDLAKGYDRVALEFLKNDIHLLGQDKFECKRGLRQGDMSSYLFIMIMGVLKSLCPGSYSSRKIELPNLRRVRKETGAVMFVNVFAAIRVILRELAGICWDKMGIDTNMLKMIQQRSIAQINHARSNKTTSKQSQMHEKIFTWKTPQNNEGKNHRALRPRLYPL
ncbi:hypothetical protein EJ110_NYTH56373 [Nymphaea thermarum]|nr:hypothetical protein EJ110_NYTH56373 [Nymphaea thermarum]